MLSSVPGQEGRLARGAQFAPRDHPTSLHHSVLKLSSKLHAYGLVPNPCISQDQPLSTPGQWDPSHSWMSPAKHIAQEATEERLLI